MTKKHINSGHFMIDFNGNRRAVVPVWGAARVDHRVSFIVREEIGAVMDNVKAIKKAWVVGP